MKNSIKLSNSELCKNCGLQKWKDKGCQGNLKVEVQTFMGGLSWNIVNNKKESLSIICHMGSYGCEDGLFEIMPSWEIKSWGDKVKGHLTFSEVQRYINILIKRGS